MNPAGAVRNFMRRNPITGVMVIGAIGAAIFSASGLLAPVTRGAGRVFGTVQAVAMRLLGGNGAAKALLALTLLGGWAACDAESLVATYDVLAAGGFHMAVLPALFGYKKIFSERYPVTAIATSHTPQKIRKDIKATLSSGVLSRGYVRVFGPIVKAGAGPGTATGKENPEGLIPSITLTLTPKRGVVTKADLSPRGTISIGIFERGRAIRAADITDAAATVQVDFQLPLTFKQPGAAVPIEYALPLDLFSSALIEIVCAGRQELFTGGTNTYDLSGLVVELWLDVDFGVAGDGPKAFHLTEEFEQTFPITATQPDFPIELPEGYVYTHLLFMAERDNVLVDDIVRNIAIESNGREWWPHGEENAVSPAAGVPSPIRRANLEEFVSDPAETLVGLYYFHALRDGSYRRAIDAGDQKVKIRLNVLPGGGTSRQVTVRGKRLVPLALQLPQGAANAA